MMERIGADLIRKKLAQLSDDQLLAFVKANLLDALNHVQVVKLQELVNSEVGMEEWFVNVDEEALRLTALNLDLATLQKVQGVFTEAEVQSRVGTPRLAQNRFQNEGEGPPFRSAPWGGRE